ncbi:hypothetical protein K491DRAFT_591724 [Lophiostoma macrostomum CBS 122681]|uniref:Peptidase S54 rhomboid domain-containing protein n=1 Tax=Lophiostoma macrostomum CBS 122681 TaxID=1314788 RepID=A0A6A6TH84_9PLEO|nr:hypothetical protein K491DRAFT_591724 [Lophiostoma macrostomum CBS 122681]
MHTLRVLHPISRSFSSSSQPLSALLRHQGPYRRFLHLQTRGKPRQLQAQSPWLPVSEHVQHGSPLTRFAFYRALQNSPGANKSRYRRHTSSPSPPQQNDWVPPSPRIPKLRIAGPVAWAAIVSAGIFISLAYLEAREQLKPPPSERRSPALWERSRPQQTFTPATEVAQQWWRDQDAISKTTIGIMGANLTVHLTRFVVPEFWHSLWHIPMRPVNYSLFTSMFVHSGSFHLLFNLWACNNFIPPVGASRLFEGNPYHMLSFFLSTGVLSGLGQHLSTKLARSLTPMVIPAGGASGALFGFLGAFCMQYPDAELGIILLPFRFDAQSFLGCVMLFDFLGMVGLYNLGLGHGAHLSGALVGVGYSYFDGKNNIWKPLVDFWKRRLKGKPL